MNQKQARWVEILQNQSRGAQSDQEALERVARYAARENARAEHLQRTLGEVAAALENAMGKQAEWDELLGQVTVYIRAGITEANQVAFRAQKEAGVPPVTRH
jgi:hypothetical protein